MSAADKIKESFISGMIMIIPLLITVFIIKLLTGWAFIFINPIVQGTDLTRYTANIRVVAQIIAGISVIGFITVLGYLSSYKVSGQVRKTMLKVVKDIPLFGTVYTTVKQISNAFTEGGSRFREVVLVEFPKEGIYSIGLVTSDAPDAMEKSLDKDMETVFVPLSPNPTMGNLIMVDESQYTRLDMKVQKGMKLLLTTGIAYEEEELPEEIKQAKQEEE
ncbi:MAG: DUF502 domain-containing protein [Candidatus Nanosalina sp.]